MTKSELIEQVSAQCPTLKKTAVEQAVNLMFDRIMAQLRGGQKVEIRGFGSFRLRRRRAKEGRNPKTNAPVAVAEKVVPFYKCGKELKDLMNPQGAPSSAEADTSR
jgi:integration host factor subunit beta